MPEMMVLITLPNEEIEWFIADVIDYLESNVTILDDNGNAHDIPFDDIKDWRVVTSA